MADDEVCRLNHLPTDAFVEVLLRVPALKRWRRLRLVCRRWRDVIQDRTPAPSRPVPLAFVVNYDDPDVYMATSACAYAITDDLDTQQGRCSREVWRSSNVPPRRVPAPYYGHTYLNPFDTALVGARNGVLCLCDNTVPGGAVSLVNPATGEALAVPPPPDSGQRSQWTDVWHAAYGFAYDADAERYAVVHVPCYLDRTGGFNAVHVFTVVPTAQAAAAATWREVPVPGGATCCLAAGIVSVGGATMCWVTKAQDSVVAFDLDDERVAFTKALPQRDDDRRSFTKKQALPPHLDDSGYAWHLTELHGMLGAVSAGAGRYRQRHPEKIEVWVLQVGNSGKKEWSRRYSVQVNGVDERIARPHFAHRDHVLLVTGGSNQNHQAVYGHELRNKGRTWHRGEVRSLRVTVQTPGVDVSGGMTGKFMIKGIFRYIENTEPFLFTAHK